MDVNVFWDVLDKASLIIGLVTGVATILTWRWRRSLTQAAKGDAKNMPSGQSKWLLHKAVPVLLVVLAIISVGNLGIFGYSVLNQPQPEIQANITSPLDNSSVGFTVPVSGTWKNIPSDQQLWLVIWPKNVHRAYPQEGPIKLLFTNGDRPSGTWSGTVYLGEQNAGTNETYLIITVLANSEANSTFSNYLDQGAVTGNYPGLSNLPSGAKGFDQVNVTRTK